MVQILWRLLLIVLIAIVRFGSNNYKESAIRQWLNSDEAKGHVWKPQTEFDRPPAWFETADGFMYGMDAGFLSVIGKTHIITCRNTLSDGGGFDEMDDYFFLLSGSEMYAANETDTVIEGTPYPYYSRYSDLQAPGPGNDSNRIKYRSGSPSYYWTRTPDRGNANRVRDFNPSGSMYTSNANFSSVAAPACCII